MGSIYFLRPSQRQGGTGILFRHPTWGAGGPSCQRLKFFLYPCQVGVGRPSGGQIDAFQDSTGCPWSVKDTHQLVITTHGMMSLYCGWAGKVHYYIQIYLYLFHVFFASLYRNLSRGGGVPCLSLKIFPMLGMIFFSGAPLVKDPTPTTWLWELPNMVYLIYLIKFKNRYLHKLNLQTRGSCQNSLCDCKLVLSLFFSHSPRNLVILGPGWVALPWFLLQPSNLGVIQDCKPVHLYPFVSLQSLTLPERPGGILEWKIEISKPAVKN